MASPGTAAIALVNATLNYVRRIFCIPLAEAAAAHSALHRHHASHQEVNFNRAGD